MCDCIKKANKALAADHTVLDTKMAINFGKRHGTMKQVLVVPTRATKKGIKPRIVQINFCPLCGEKAA